MLWRRLSNFNPLWAVFILLFATNDVLGDSEKSSDTKTTKNLNKLADASNDLAFKLYSRLAGEGAQNIVFSPLSLSDAFGTLFIGTRGNTRQELRNVLGYNTANLPSNQVPLAFGSYLNLVLSTNKNYTLDLANKLLLKKDIQVKPMFKKDAEKYFKTDVERVDFENNPNQIVDEVNAFVKKETHGKIDKILKSVDPSTAILLLNAIYFKGAWTQKFDKDNTKNLTFYENGLKSEPKEVPFMDSKQTRRYPYTEIDGTQALELPYKGDDISMVFILPGKKDGLQELEKSLTLDKFNEFLNKLRIKFVYVKIPKFKIKYSHQMAEEFEALGAKQIFTGAADFTGITPDQGLAVNSVLHKAVIEVNEEGSEAAAVTAIQIIPASPGPPIRNPHFVADHPFIFTIIDKRNDMILFMGRVTEL